LVSQVGSIQQAEALTDPTVSRQAATVKRQHNLQEESLLSIHDEINRVLHPLYAWGGIQGFCDWNVTKLGDNLRISDDAGEGVLFINRTNNLFRTENYRLQCAAVHQRNITREVGLSYALSNGRENPVGPYQIISWEAPLLRRIRTDNDILDVKCDLVAYDATAEQLVAVEVKLNSGNDDTKIQHGLLQSMSYGYLLQHSLNANSSGLRRQVQMCLDQWCGIELDELPTIKSVACALAAPKQYFRDSLTLDGNLNHEKIDWLQRAIDIDNSGFSKFWVIDGEYEIKTAVEVGDTLGANYRLPQIVDCRISFFDNVNQLAMYCLQE
jgi:hypothetical protein